MRQGSIDEQIKQHEGLVFHTLKMLRCSYSNEAISVAYEALWRAIQTFDEDRGVQFSTYAVTCIKNSVYDLFRIWQEIQEHEVPLDLEHHPEPYTLEEFDKTECKDDTELRKAVDDTLNKFSGKKRKIAYLWLESNLSDTAIAQEVPCSQSYASQVIKEVKATLRKDLKDAKCCRDYFTNISDK